MSPTFFGKYKGTVSDNKDPLMMGRVRAKVLDVLGDHESGWALPAMPFAGQGMGFFAIPPVGSGVWIEFEKGDPDYPIWTGGWWGSTAEVPPNSIVPVPYKKLIIKLEGGTTLILDDTPVTGGIFLETNSGQKLTLNSLGVEMVAGQAAKGITISAGLAKITLGPQGIEINDGAGGTIKMQGPKVDVNSGALSVM